MGGHDCGAAAGGRDRRGSVTALRRGGAEVGSSGWGGGGQGPRERRGARVYTGEGATTGFIRLLGWAATSRWAGGPGERWGGPPRERANCRAVGSMGRRAAPRANRAKTILCCAVDPWAKVAAQAALHSCSGQPGHDSPSGRVVPVTCHYLVLRVGPWAVGHMANYSLISFGFLS